MINITTRSKSHCALENMVHFPYTSVIAGMAELVYAHDSKSCAARLVGSSPTSGIEILEVSPVLAR